ncbi:DNA-binding MarR family transcriptional regulator [Amycolatopsis bartoniae]|uniref:MarR family winged helix-turn-helix transcriptional regulator n=1 Tax=Amycolatopsis bartoniae TaxID=941986 RepID=UPI0017AEDC99|nr:MarR family transcriptional regulator [Amycolatopsis bartoniae]MBB2936458.1 DNA-binding MarR family transcriptional regulator [Amycolatopsis bartoniae]
MGDSGDKAVALMRELRTAAQLQHAWLTQSWQHAGTSLHPAAVTVLSELGRHGECRPSDLAKRKMVDVSVISRQIAQLAAAGLVERRPAPEDGRASLVRISAAGRAQLERWRDQYLEYVGRALGDWTEDELESLTTRLTLMNQGLRDALVPAVCPPQAGEQRK